MENSTSPEKKTLSSDSKLTYEQMLNNAILMTEMSLDIKERAQTGEKYVCHLRSLAIRASRAITAMNNSARQFVILGQRLTSSTLRQLDTSIVVNDINDPELQNIRTDYERLVGILDREILDHDDLDNIETTTINDLTMNFTNTERIRNLEIKQRYSEQTTNLRNTLSSRSLRSEFDEKYPDNWSKDSLISLGNIVNLPPVPEDAFTSFSKPMRTSSLSSLKSIRKVKLFLQRNVTSEDEESECDDHELSMSDEPTSSSEGGETRSVALSVKKVGGLCNIKEENPQDP